VTLAECDRVAFARALSDTEAELRDDGAAHLAAAVAENLERARADLDRARRAVALESHRARAG
jgi:hypothetical protein